MNKYLLQKTMERTTGTFSDRVFELSIYLGTGNIHAWVSRGGESVAEANTAAEPLRTLLPTRGDVRAARKVGQVLGDRLNHLEVPTAHYCGSIALAAREDFRRHSELLLGVHRCGVRVTVDGASWKRLNRSDRHRSIEWVLEQLRRSGVRCSVPWHEAVRAAPQRTPPADSGEA